MDRGLQHPFVWRLQRVELCRCHAAQGPRMHFGFGQYMIGHFNGILGRLRNHGTLAGMQPSWIDFQDGCQSEGRPAGAAMPAFVAGDCTLRYSSRAGQFGLRHVFHSARIAQSV